MGSKKDIRNGQKWYVWYVDFSLKRWQKPEFPAVANLAKMMLKTVWKPRLDLHGQLGLESTCWIAAGIWPINHFPTRTASMRPDNPLVIKRELRGGFSWENPCHKYGRFPMFDSQKATLKMEL